MLEDLITRGTLCSLVEDRNMEVMLLLERHDGLAPHVSPSAPPAAMDTYIHLLKLCGVQVQIGSGYTD